MTAVPPVLTSSDAPVSSPAHTSAAASRGRQRAEPPLKAEFIRTVPRLAHSGPSRAVSRNGSIGTPGMFGVRPDRFDHEVGFFSAVDLARYTIGHTGPDVQGFGEVIEPVNAFRVAVPQQKHRA